jgi:hypothetical protein
MGFLTQRSVTENHPDLILFKDFWRFMDGDTVGGVSSSNLFWFLLTVKGADLPDRTFERLDRVYDYQPAEGEEEDMVLRLSKYGSI